MVAVSRIEVNYDGFGGAAPDAIGLGPRVVSSSLVLHPFV